MSKIYNKYLELKKEDKDKLYLFKAGKFYIFLGEDCDFINDYVVLKKVKFCNETYKCGFPENVLEQYLRVFKNHNLNIALITDLELNKNEDIYNFISKIDINNLTPLEALEKLSILKEMINNDKKCGRN